ncbi:MAG: YfhO family protein [Clostridiales bacterium]|nr:YfhO family protein [Clostridiales bacterium]
MTLLEQKQHREERQRRLIAFLLPAFAFYFGFVAHGLWPFGNKHLLAYDLYHQYAPFLLELKRKILSGEGLFFSWSGGLGVNYYSFFTYYTASPFNILVLFFPDQFIAEAVTLITLLKIGFSSFFFYEFLSRSYRKSDSTAALFSSFYAISAWVYAYSWNIMWLDTLVFLPLACLGLVELVRHGKVKRFVIGLCLMLMTNYYTAFFGAVFLFLFYFVLRVQFAPKREGRPDPLFAFLKFAGSSLLSALLSAVVLWPTVRALSITSAAGDSFPKGFSFTQPFLETLGRMTPLRSPHIMSGLPNIFAGTFILLLIPAFFANRSRPARVRVAYGLLLGFLFFSFQSKTLSFLWHGGHYPNSLDFRYAFVFIFLVLTMAYQAAGDATFKLRTPMNVVAIAAFVLLLTEQQWSVNDQLSHWRLLAFVILAISYLAIFGRFTFSKNSHKKQVPEPQASYLVLGRHQMRASFIKVKLLSLPRKIIKSEDAAERQKRIRHLNAKAMLSVLLTVELLFVAFSSAALYQQVAPLGDRQYYTSNDYATELYASVEELQNTHKGEPWRAEVLPDTCVNDPFLFGTQGMSLFASPFPHSSIDFFSDLGYPTNGVNSFQYKESTIVMDSLLGIDYLFVKNSRIFDDRTRHLVEQGDTLRLLQNDDAIPFGFFATPEISYMNDEIMPDDAPDVQNRLVSALSGQSGPLIKEAFRPWEFEGCYVEQSYDPYSFHVSRAAGNTEWAFLVYDVPRDGIYYIFWEDESVGINYSNGFIRDEEFFQLGSSKRGIGDVGFLEAGTELHFRVSMPSENSIHGSFRACVARLDEVRWQETRERLAAHPFELSTFSSTHFEGTITAPSKGFLFLPTTTNPGWTFKVDGKVTQAEAVRGAFILIPLEAGTHDISASFAPVGFYQGLWVSVAALLLTLGFCLWMRKRKARDMMNLSFPTKRAKS